MKRAKLILPSGGKSLILGREAKLVDADTGEELVCIGDITLRIPMDGAITAGVDIQISEIETAIMASEV
jgi:hypothetical protein